MKVQLNDIRPADALDIEPVNHSPGFDYCRKLIKEGVNPNERLDIYRGDILAYSITNIGWGAKMKVLDNEKRGPAFKKYESFNDNRIPTA